MIKTFNFSFFTFIYLKILHFFGHLEGVMTPQTPLHTILDIIRPLVTFSKCSTCELQSFILWHFGGLLSFLKAHGLSFSKFVIFRNLRRLLVHLGQYPGSPHTSCHRQRRKKPAYPSTKFITKCQIRNISITSDSGASSFS